MITEVEFLVGAGIAQFVLPIQGLSPTAPMHVRSIDGLDPVTAEIITRSNADDGDFYNDSRVGKRNIVITLGLNPAAGYDKVEEARRRLYAYVMPKSFVKLQFTSTNRPLVVIDGVVEGIKAPLFAKDPEAQISIICPKSNFVAKNPVVVTGTADDTPALVDFINPGDKIAQIEMAVHHQPGSTEDYSRGLVIETRDSRPQFRRFTLKPTVYNLDAPGGGSTPVPYPYISSDTFFYLNTNQGQKQATSLYEPGFTGTPDPFRRDNLLRWVDLFAPWLYVSPGINQIRVYSANEVDSDGDPVPNTGPHFPWTLTFYPQYGGL